MCVCFFKSYVLKKFFQILLQLKEVDGGDETLLVLGQTVSAQLNDLVVDEAQDSVCQREDVLRGEGLDEVSQPPFHLRCGLVVGGGGHKSHTFDPSTSFPKYHYSYVNQSLSTTALDD